MSNRLSKKRKCRYQPVNQDIDYEDDDEDDDEDEDDYYCDEYREVKTNKKILQDVKKEIKRSEPSITQILNEPLLMSDRADLLQLYEIYKSSDKLTIQYLETRNSLIKLFSDCKNNFAQYSKYTLKQHEKMKSQLDVLDSYNADHEIQYKILQLNTCLTNKQVIYSRYKELKSMPANNEEYGKLKNWINWAISIPHDNLKTFPFTESQLTQFLRQVAKMLDKELYGMESVKEQILLFVSSKIQNPHMKKCSLGLVGASGTGKSHISRLLAQVLDFPFEQISFGGVSNPDFLKGHEYTYIGAQPGEIVKCLKRMGYKNGILFLDEYEKISDNKDMCSALLHITDPVQNSEFRDKFLSEITIDLSNIWFIYSMNNLPNDSALKDRIFSIYVSGYKLVDKINIVVNYLFPKALKNVKLDEKYIIISDDVAKHLVEKVSSPEELGVRTIEKSVNDIVNKVSFLINHQNKKGKLEGFNTSFELGKFIKYPINLTSDMIDKLIR